MSRLTRKEMKQDKVGEFLSRTLLWLGEHAKQIAVGAGIVVVAIIVGSLIVNRSGGRHDAASDALADAIEVRSAPLTSDLSSGVAPAGDTFATADERSQEAKRRFEAVIADYPRSQSARVARAYVAQLDYQASEPAAAREIWNELATDDEDDLLAVQVLLNLITLDRQEGRAADAEARLLDLVDNPQSVLPQSHVLYELGLTQEALGKSDEAQTNYRRLLDEYPTSPLARTASAKLSQAGDAA